MAVSEEATPFEYLLSVDRKCIAHQGGLVQQESDVSFSHGLAFQLGDHKYIIPIADVSEVLAVDAITSIPRSPTWLVGISNVRGNLITLLDIHEFVFGEPMQDKYDTRRMLLIKQESHYYGLIIDSIIGMKSFDANQGIDEVPESFDYDHIDHISAFYSSGEEWFAALSVQSLLTDERFSELRNLS
ncbi:MAG: chemotaxis protein CheW [Gammaproteobacteria bacterium]